METISVIRPKKILVVDDDEPTRIGMSHILSKEGYHVDSFSNGYEALSFLSQEEVDLVITDINMPEMNGIVFLKALAVSNPNINVIMITGYGKAESYIESINHGAYDYLTKPVNILDLLALLKKILSE
jgi:DNA-binding NtrC family response regulator